MPANHVEIIEVGPRDGLQSAAFPWPTKRKVDLVDRLSAAGLRRIEVTSFVAPRAVPQLADAEAVMAMVTRRPGLELSALTPNARGLERAMSAKVDRVAVFTSASETFAQRNIGCSIDEAMRRFAVVVQMALAAHLPVRGYISMAWHCPYEGEIDLDVVVALAHRLEIIGCDQIVLADTIGTATPPEVRRSIERLVSEGIDPARIAVHLHDTSGQAEGNVEAALAVGVRVFDAAIGGLGGCPFAPGSPGNLSTEKLIALLDRLGLTHGVDRDRLASATALALAPADTKP